MARQKSELLSLLGVVFEIVKAIVDEVLNLGGNDDDVRKILRDRNIRKEIARLLVQSKSEILATFQVVVDYKKSLAQMVQAGKYDWVHGNITQEHFPVAGRGEQEREIALFHFNHLISSDDAIREMAVAGYQPASIEELLALGESLPELQRQFPIIALGSGFRHLLGYREVPVLVRSESDDGRGLSLLRFDVDWDESYRVAAVRE